MLKHIKKYWLLIGIVIVVCLGVSAYFIFSANKSSSDSQQTSVQTAIARRGDLVVYANAAGEVIPAREMGVGFDESGKIIEILVEVGDNVKAGDVLARLQTNNTAESIAVSIANAELSVLNAQQDLDAIHDNWKIDSAQALKDVEDAQKALDDLRNSDTALKLAWETVVESQKAVADAERTYNITLSTASQADIDAAHAQVLLAEQALERAKDKYEPYANKPDDNLTKARLQASLSAAQAAYDAAVRNYNAMIGTGSDLDKDVAKAQLDTAQAQLDDAMREWERAKNGPSEGEIALAEAELASAQSRWEILKEGPDPVDVTLAQEELTRAKANLELAKQSQAEIDLVAPMDGTILSIDANGGEYVNNAAIMTLADLRHPFLRVYLDETDMDKVAVGYEADVTFDAIPDQTFTGKVISVNPSLVTVSNVKTIEAIVQLDVNSFAKPMILPIGLNASVDIIGGRADKVVLVPVEAVREISPGEYGVFVMENGEPKLQMVEVGLMDFTSAEIISGLKAGDIVTTGIVKTSTELKDDVKDDIIKTGK